MLSILTRSIDGKANLAGGNTFSGSQTVSGSQIIDGRLIIQGSPGYVLFTPMTEAVRDTIVGVNGMVIFNSDALLLEVYVEGTGWVRMN